MPLFEYLCRECETRSEVLVRGAEKPACPECNSTRLEKQMSRITPMGESMADPVPAGCGMQNCCQMTGGGCPNGLPAFSFEIKA